MAETKHQYPSKYPPGTHWAVDLAWQCLDVLPIGLLSIEQRSLVAGMITGLLLRDNFEEIDVSKEAESILDILPAGKLSSEQATLITHMITRSVRRVRTVNQ